MKSRPRGVPRRGIPSSRELRIGETIRRLEPWLSMNPAAHPEDTQTIFREVVKDRRRFPRIKLKQPGTVLAGDGELVAVEVYDFSPDGVQIRCDRPTAQKILPSGQLKGPTAKGPEVLLAFDAKVKAGAKQIKLSGKIAYFALINQTTAAFGLQFRKMSPENALTLKALLEESMEPA